MASDREPRWSGARTAGARGTIDPAPLASELARVNAQLQEALRRIQVHLQQTPVAVVEWDAAGTVLAWNPAAERMFGWSAEEMVGTRLGEGDFIHREDWPAVRRLMDDMIAGARPSVRQLNRNVRRDGRVLHCEWYNSTLFDDAGALVSVMSLGLDVTDRLRAEEALTASERRWREVTEALPQLVWSSLPDGRYDYLSRQWLEFTGLPEGAQRGDGWIAALHPDDRARTRDAWVAALDGRAPLDVDYRIRRADGAYRWFKARAVPVRDASGAVVRWFGSCTDIDDQVRAQDALRDADRRKDQFLAALAHELRNPLAPIRNGLHLLARGGDLARSQRVLQVVDRQVTHLARIVDDLLEVSRITRGRIELRRVPMDLAAVVRDTVDDHRELLAASGLEVRLETPAAPLPILGDRTRVAQMVGNLLSNAAKFTPAGGEVAIRVEPDAGAALVAVRDTGEGIDPETRAHLFEPFSQGDRTLARSRGGLGLGLALVKGLAELHGGTVEVRSEGPGHGTDARLRFPLIEGTQAAAEPRAPHGSRRARVLLVEDNVDAAETLREALQLEGHQVAVAYDGRAGLAAAREWRPDVVFCDVGLPGAMDGYALARALRADPALRAIPLVALTGYAAPDDRRRAAEAGFDRHLAKPAPLDDVLRAVGELVGR